MSNDTLMMNGTALVPTSRTSFAGTYHVDFAVNDRGEVTHLVYHGGGGDRIATRPPSQ